MDKLNTYSEMENVKDILMSFREYWNKLPNIMIHEDDIDKYINTLKYRHREPEANECNEPKGKLCRKFEDCKKLQCAKFNCKSNEYNKCYEAQ